MKQFVWHLMKKQVVFQQEYMDAYNKGLRANNAYSRYISSVRTGRNNNNSNRNLTHIGSNSMYSEYSVFGDIYSVPQSSCIDPQLYQILPILFEFLRMSFHEWPNDFMDYAREIIDIWLIIIAPWKCEKICNQIAVDLNPQPRNPQQQRRSNYTASTMHSKIEYEHKFAYTNSAHKYSDFLYDGKKNKLNDDGTIDKLNCFYYILAFIAIAFKFLFNEISNIIYFFGFYFIQLILYLIDKITYLKTSDKINKFGVILESFANKLLIIDENNAETQTQSQTQTQTQTNQHRTELGAAGASQSNNRRVINNNSRNNRNDSIDNHSNKRNLRNIVSTVDVGKGSFVLETVGFLLRQQRRNFLFSRSYYESNKLLTEKDILMKKKDLRGKFKKALNISFENTQSKSEFLNFVSMYGSFENEDIIYKRYKQYIVELLPFYCTLLPLFFKLIHLKSNNVNNLELSNQLYYTLRIFNSNKLINLISNCEKCIYQGMTQHSPNSEDAFIMNSVLRITNNNNIFKLSNYYNEYASPFTSQSIGNKTQKQCQSLLIQLATSRYEWDEYLNQENRLLNRMRRMLNQDGSGSGGIGGINGIGDSNSRRIGGGITGGRGAGSGGASPVVRSRRQEEDEKAETETEYETEMATAGGPTPNRNVNVNANGNGNMDGNRNSNRNTNGENDFDLDDPRTRINLCVHELSSMFNFNVDNVNAGEDARLLGPSFWRHENQLLMNNMNNMNNNQRFMNQNQNQNQNQNMDENQQMQQARQGGGGGDSRSRRGGEGQRQQYHNYNNYNMMQREDVWKKPQTQWESVWLMNIISLIDFSIFKIVFRWIPFVCNNILLFVIFVFKSVGLDDYAIQLEMKQREKQRQERNRYGYGYGYGNGYGYGGGYYSKWLQIEYGYRNYVSWFLRKLTDLRLWYWGIGIVISWYFFGSLWSASMFLILGSMCAYLILSFIEHQRKNHMW